jgi:hypothetical protein
MRRNLALIGLLCLLLVALVAAPPASAHDRNVRGDLDGYQETPAVSTGASGEFKAKISKDESSIEYELSYSGLEGDVRQAHIHFAQRGVAGGIVVWLCQTTFNVDPTGLSPMCPQEGMVTGTLTAANMVGGAAGQGISPGEFAELIQAIRAKVAYANVHSTKFPTGEIRAQLK